MASPPDKAEGASRAQVAAWMARYGPGLKRFFARRASQEEADDLVQEVFLRLQARADENAVDNIEGFLFGIAKHVLVSRYRAEKSDGLFHYGVLNENVDAPDEMSPERILAAKQEVLRAVVAILALPPRTRAAFELHRFEKLSYSAIAKRMGISKGAVQDLMQRAIDRLADEMESGQ